jgi:hypothetical protein
MMWELAVAPCEPGACRPVKLHQGLQRRGWAERACSIVALTLLVLPLRRRSAQSAIGCHNPRGAPTQRGPPAAQRASKPPAAGWQTNPRPTQSAQRARTVRIGAVGVVGGPQQLNVLVSVCWFTMIPSKAKGSPWRTACCRAARSAGRRRLAPENVGSRFLSLLQSAPDQTLSAIFGTAEKPNCRRHSRVRLGGSRAERYGKSLSECQFVSEAWGLAVLLYKLFLQRFQQPSLVVKPESRYPFRLLAGWIGATELLRHPQAHAGGALRQLNHQYPWRLR